MVEADRRAVEEFGIAILQMMEHAGRAVADAAIDRFQPSTVTVLVGSGGNGGGGLAAARHLTTRGVSTTVVRSSDRASTEVARHLRTVTAMGIPIADRPPAADVVIDAMVGYSARGPLHGRAARLAGAVAGLPTVSLDLPSGLDADGGPQPGSVRAELVVSLALPKPGLLDPIAGDVVLADIGLPPSIWAGLVEQVPADLFAAGRLIRLDRTATGFAARAS